MWNRIVRSRGFWILSGLLLIGVSLYCLMIAKGLFTHSWEHMDAVRWRPDARGQFAWTLAALAILIFGHGWAILRWTRRQYAAVFVTLVLAYAVPMTIFMVGFDLHRLAMERKIATKAEVSPAADR